MMVAVMDSDETHVWGIMPHEQAGSSRTAIFSFRLRRDGAGQGTVNCWPSCAMLAWTPRAPRKRATQGPMRRSSPVTIDMPQWGAYP